MPSKDGDWSDQEKVFVREMARTSDTAYAAEKAGYRSPRASASQLMKRPPVVAEIRRLQREQLTGLVTLCFDHAEKVMRSDDETTKSKTEVMKALLAHARAVESAEGETKELYDMSGPELNATVMAIERRIAELQSEANTIEHQAPAEPVDEGIFG